MCGIVAYTGRQKPNFAALKLMMILQKSRGTDGVGFVYNNIRLTSHDDATNIGHDKGDPEKYFGKYYFADLKGKKPFANNTVIIHNRSRSKGAYGHGAIHPWVYVKDGVTHYFAHNGTLSNEDELQKKYKLEDLKFESDTHLLGYLVVHFGFEVLREYIGTAAFVYMRTDEPNSIYVWKGASKHLATSDVPEEERPLYYAELDGGIYIASLQTTLQCALDLSSDQVMYVGDCHLIKFDYSTKKILIDTTIIDRGHIEKPVFTPTYSQTNHTTRSTNVYTTNMYERQECDKHISESIDDKRTKGKLYYQAGKYYRNGHAFTTDATGIRLLLDGSTSTRPASSRLIENECHLYFYNGLMLKDQEAYFKLKEKYPNKKELKENYAEIAEFLDPLYPLFWWDVETSGLNIIHNNKLINHNISAYMIPFSYGGYFFDKVCIAFFAEKFPNSIVKETTYYSGENAFIFGEVAKEFEEITANYLLD